MSGRKFRVLDLAPNDVIGGGVLVTPAKLVVSEVDHGVADYSIAELQSIAAKVGSGSTLGRTHYNVTDEKRERVKANNRKKLKHRKLTVGTTAEIGSLISAKLIATGNPKEFLLEWKALS